MTPSTIIYTNLEGLNIANMFASIFEDVEVRLMSELDAKDAPEQAGGFMQPEDEDEDSIDFSRPARIAKRVMETITQLGDQLEAMGEMLPPEAEGIPAVEDIAIAVELAAPYVGGIYHSLQGFVAETAPELLRN